MARADKRSTAYSNIFGRSSDRRSQGTPSPAQLHMTAAVPSYPSAGPYYAGPPPFDSGRRASVSSQLDRPTRPSSCSPASGLFQQHASYGPPAFGPPPHPQHPSSHESMYVSSYPEAGPSRTMSAGSPVMSHTHVHQWQRHALPPSAGAYVDTNERTRSFDSRTTSSESRTQSFGDGAQSFLEPYQDSGPQDRVLQPRAMTSSQPHPADGLLGLEYAYPYIDYGTPRQSTGSGFDVAQPPDQDAASPATRIAENGAFAGFDQHGAAAPPCQMYPEKAYRRASRDSESNSVYAGLEYSGPPSAGNTVGPFSRANNSTLFHVHPRKSSESVRVMPTQPKAEGVNHERSFSFTGSARPPDSGQGTNTLINRKAPIVYPALLSRVAEAFQMRIMLGERAKDGLTYADSFDGRDAVDKIAYIIKTTDRNLALLLGRALDAQKFFHDVTYDHRLRDSPHELYQFRARLASQFASHEEVRTDYCLSGLTELGNGGNRRHSLAESINTNEEPELPCGVFTLLTDCYSPTCTRDRLCYSIACPRRLEQQARLNMKPKPGLKRAMSTESLNDLKEPGTLWIHSVPQEVVDSVSDQEKKRQEALNECIYTERDFVRDMEYLRDVWIRPLQSGTIIPEGKRQDFVLQVFWNVLDVLAVNARLCELLSKRQKSAHIVPRLGDIYLELVPHFAPFVQYGAHQLYGKYEFEKEKSSNPAFAKFVDETERSPQSRKLELNAYLTKPTTRLARYPLLLQVVEKYTPVENSDKQDIPKVIKMIRELLAKVNVETGKSENRFNLAQLDQQLVFRPGEAVDLRLREEGRDMIYKGPLKKRGGSGSDNAELQVFLFDHALLMVKQKNNNKSEQMKVYRKPIPLELLTISGVTEENGNARPVPGRKMLINRSSTSVKPAANGITPPQPFSKQGYPMTLNHLGRKGYSILLWAPTWASRQKWLERIENRQNELREQSMIFEMITLSNNFFIGTNKVNCAAPFDQGQRLVYGTDSGVYLATNNVDVAPVRVIAVINVTQVDVLEEQGILLVLADKAVMTFWIDSLDPNDAIGAAKRARKISSHASFFKVGECLGRRLVCVVKSGSVSSTIKTLEPVEQHGRGKKQPALRKFLQGSNDALRVFKEFYIPTESSSVHFLKSKLCVGCSKGFEVVDLDTLDTQGLLDPADSSLDFVSKRENVKPVAIYRVEGDFLLCYDDFAFYVNKNGWRAKSNWLIQWEGHPTGFALHYPFVLAFEPTFIEVRHVETGALMQIIPGPNIRHLFAEAPPSTSASVLAARVVRNTQYENGRYGYAPSPSYGHSAYTGRLQSSYMGTMNMTVPTYYRGEIIFAAEGKVIQVKLASR